MGENGFEEILLAVSLKPWQAEIMCILDQWWCSQPDRASRWQRKGNDKIYRSQ